MFNLDRRSYTRRYLDSKINEECKNLKGLILDIGGGETDYSGYFGKDAKVITMDINPDAGPKVVCDATKPLPFLENSFDYAFSMNVIEHIHDAPTYLSETHRVLKENGVFFMSAVFVYPYHSSNISDDFYRFTDRGIETMLKKAGFRKVETHKLGGRFSVAAESLAFLIPTNFLSGLTRSISFPFLKFMDKNILTKTEKQKGISYYLTVFVKATK